MKISASAPYADTVLSTATSIHSPGRQLLFSSSSQTRHLSRPAVLLPARQTHKPAPLPSAATSNSSSSQPKYRALSGTDIPSADCTADRAQEAVYCQSRVPSTFNGGGAHARAAVQHTLAYFPWPARYFAGLPCAACGATVLTLPLVAAVDARHKRCHRLVSRARLHLLRTVHSQKQYSTAGSAQRTAEQCEAISTLTCMQQHSSWRSPLVCNNRRCSCSNPSRVPTTTVQADSSTAEVLLPLQRVLPSCSFCIELKRSLLILQQAGAHVVCALLLLAAATPAQQAKRVVAACNTLPVTRQD
jgi:hypothetical protein